VLSRPQIISNALDIWQSPAVKHCANHGAMVYKMHSNYAVCNFTEGHVIGARAKLAKAAAGLSLRELEQHLDGRVTAQARNAGTEEGSNRGTRQR